MNLYSHLGNELRSLFEHLFDPLHADFVKKKMAQILHTATQIGSPIKEEAQELNQDILNYLKKPSEKLKAKLKSHALRLDEQTREI